MMGIYPLRRQELFCISKGKMEYMAIAFKIHHYHNQLDTSKFVDMNHIEKVYDVVLQVVLDSEK